MLYMLNRYMLIEYMLKKAVTSFILMNCFTNTLLFTSLCFMFYVSFIITVFIIL